VDKLQRFVPSISIVLFVIAIIVVHHEINVYHWVEIRKAIFGIDPALIWQAVWMTIFSYLVLSLYDLLAMKYAGEKLPYRCILLTSFFSYAFSNSIGHSWLSGGSMRYRLYSGWGLSGSSIAKIILFCSLTFWLGVMTLLVGCYTFADEIFIKKKFPLNILLLAPMVSIALLLCWWFVVLFYRKTLTIKNFAITPPSVSISLQQTIVGVLDLLLASAVLYLPLSHYMEISFSNFLLLYVVSMFAGVLSQVPGGIGVFEGSFFFLASSTNQPAVHILAPLILYRSIYYILPLVVAGVGLAAYEFRLHHIWRSPQTRPLFNIIKSSIPQLFSVLLLLGGGVLLFSGATPGQPDRLKTLHYLLPLPLIEFSHLIGSMAGVVLLFLSRAVSHRLRSAYYATVVVLALGMLSSLAKGWDFEEATVLGVMLIIILPTKNIFYRKSGLLTLNFLSGWSVFYILTIIGLSVWLGFFSYKHVDYSHELWWQFTLYGDAPRFLRSLVAIGVVSASLLFYRLLTQPVSTPNLPGDQMIEKAYAILRNSSYTMNHLAIIGDKRLLWSETGNSFLMFNCTPKYWIAMGDPVGDSSEFEDLAWKFMELADSYSAKIAFYQVSKDYLPVYLNLGLNMIKLGEEARVYLPTFGLEGRKRQSLRQSYNKQQRDGLIFEIISAEAVEKILPQLRAISDSWLDSKRSKEKKFSLGYFDEVYLKRSAIAVAKIVINDRERIVAFANLWELDNKDELSIDLMRYDDRAPSGTMEFLTISLMLWGKEQGYEYFNLGMAPLSGLERHPLAPLWQKIGDSIFRLSTEFYNFEGLYQYKKKFDPEWQPRYLAAPSSLQVASVLLAATSLISGGVEGVLKK